MLNTKPIKKITIDGVDITKTQGTEINTNKIIENNNSISNKDILNLHNEKINNEKENSKAITDITKQRELKHFFKGGNYNSNNDYQELETETKIKENNNDFINELAYQLKNELKPSTNNSKVIIVTDKNLIDNENKNTLNAEWDENNNAFVIRDNNNIEGVFTNSDIVKSIIVGSNINKSIKKYFFIITYDENTDTKEFNFIDSVFTDNLDLIIRTQNSLFDLINNTDMYAEYNDDEKNNNFLIFNYQFIIYLFKKSYYLNNIDSIKITKFYSTLTYRFSSLVLKNIFKIENDNVNLSNDINKLLDIKNDISSQLLNIENYLNKTITDTNINNYNNSSTSKKTITQINISTTFNDTDTENETQNHNETQNETETETENKTESESESSKTILDKIISSLSNNNILSQTYQENDNGYREINDDVSTYMDKQISGEFNEKNNHYKIINKNVSSVIPSYNKNSAINNGKIYKIKL
jgi:hypothetical protein